jgi:flavin reductase (DIM6/NTAB) family NADH-FMN oxidoreductase RutF
MTRRQTYHPPDHLPLQSDFFNIRQLNGRLDRRVLTDREIALGSAEYREIMGHFCTGVVIVTALFDGQPYGFTCQSFVSVSLDPPLVSFCPSRTSSSWPNIRESGRFCVNVLAEDQAPLCDRFAKSGGEKFAGLPWTTSDAGTPLLEGCIAHVECDLEYVHEAGDHFIAIGHVLDLQVGRASGPLLYFQGEYATIAARHQA